MEDGGAAGPFRVQDLSDVPRVGPLFAEVAEKYPGVSEPRLIGESIRRLIGLMVEDLLGETRRRVQAAHPRSADAVRGPGRPLVGLSEPLRQPEPALRAFLPAHLYGHERLPA